MLFIGIIVALLLFTFIVFIHELGHFLSARFFGVKVDEFGIGIPPKAKKIFTDKLGTIYTLNWLPIGGFVRLKGESPENLKNKNDSDAFINKSYFAKSVILLAGVFMNFLLASIIFSLLFIFGVKPAGINNQIETNLESKIIPNIEQSYKIGLLQKNNGLVLNPVKGSISEISGIESGDIVYEINGTKVNTFIELTNTLKNNIGKEVVLKIDNTLNKNIDWQYYDPANGELSIKKEIKIIVPEDGKIGSYVGENIYFNKNYENKFSILQSIRYGFYETYVQSRLTLKGIGILFKKLIKPETKQERTEALSQVKGPIGLVDIISSSLSNGFKFILLLGAIISINLGVFNLLPIPALDGGRFLIITINDGLKKILGKKVIHENIEGIIHLTFFVILIAFSILIGYNDINSILKK